MMSVLLVAGCTQHNRAGDPLRVMPKETVRVNEAAPFRHAAATAEPDILGLAEEQDIESLRLSRCQTHNSCK
ncbi:hypothetical protein [Paenochrobactrum sp. BZR 201-1]